MRAFRPVLFFLPLVALWVTIFALAVITAIAFIASTSCANCQSAFGNEDATSLTGFYATNRDPHTTHEQISTFVYQHNSYFQSLHIILLQAVATFCLAISAPSVWEMIWSRLDYSADSIRKPMTMALLQNSITLAQSLNLEAAFFYITKSRSLPHPVLFVVLVAILSRFAPLAVSPIYKPHNGPYLVNASVIVGGGVGISTYGLSYDSSDIVPGGLESGRALLGAKSYLKVNIAPTVYDVSVAPFILQDTIQAIWKAQIKTVVARNTLDCGSSSPLRLWNTTDSDITQDIVALDPGYFAPNSLSHDLAFSIGGHQFEDQLTNEPLITPTYLNTTFTNAMGSVTAVTSVIFLAANGTFEGSQQTITSPEPKSRITSVDVLVCTSNTTLEVSYCNIDRGQVQSCSASNTDDLGEYIGHPETVATILAASPVTAFYHLANLLPVYDLNRIGKDFISSQLPPLSYLSIDAAMNSYNIPLNYTQNVLFGQTAQGIVQGLVEASSLQQPQNLQITVTFATSQPRLLCVIMALAMSCALVATLLNKPQREVPVLDTARILAISRNHELDTMLEPYGDRNKDIGEHLLKATVVCNYNKGRHMLNIVTTNDSTVLKSAGIGSRAVPSDYELGHVLPLLGKISS